MIAVSMISILKLGIFFFCCVVLLFFLLVATPHPFLIGTLALPSFPLPSRLSLSLSLSVTECWLVESVYTFVACMELEWVLLLLFFNFSWWYEVWWCPPVLSLGSTGFWLVWGGGNFPWFERVLLGFAWFQLISIDIVLFPVPLFLFFF